MNLMEADFASVWSRVTGTRPSEDELTKLRRWIRDEWEGIAADEALLKQRIPAPVRMALRALLQQEKHQLRKLQALYYLRTGDVCVPPKTNRQTPVPLMKALRERYAAILTQADDYRQSPEGTRDLARLSAGLAAEKEAHALRLRQIVESLL